MPTCPMCHTPVRVTQAASTAAMTATGQRCSHRRHAKYLVIDVRSPSIGSSAAHCGQRSITAGMSGVMSLVASAVTRNPFARRGRSTPPRLCSSQLERDTLRRSPSVPHWTPRHSGRIAGHASSRASGGWQAADPTNGADMTKWIDEYANSLGEAANSDNVHRQHDLLRDRLIQRNGPKFSKS